jgi:TIR domain
MRQKIFISYRRQDSGANAIGISQYLEHQFGRKNVFIDVDMHAGAKFPTVLEQRLAECKVALILIGPEWLNARDEQGKPRLDDPDDWVRLEIAHALKRGITVIPIRVNGAPLPPKPSLPDDIKGLLDHQAASITLAGFRHEMAGLVRDIRSIPSSRPWRRYAAIAASLLLLLTSLSLLPWAYERVRPLLSSQLTGGTLQNGVWTGPPGEWVMFAVDKNPVAYYFKPDTVKIFGDRIAYTSRYPFVSNNANGTPANTLSQSAYADDRTVMDCKKLVSITAERTIYDNKGTIISHYKLPESDSDLALTATIVSGSILSMAQHLLCDEQLRTPLLSKDELKSNRFSHLMSTTNGDGEIYYGPIKNVSEGDYVKETLFLAKLREDHSLQGFFAGGAVRAIAPGYRATAEPLQINCTGKKILSSKFEYYDRENNLTYVAAPISVQPLDVNEGSPFSVLLHIVCGPNFGGTYQGTNNATYKTGATGEQEIVVSVEQIGQDVKVGFQTPGGQGAGNGTLTENRVQSITFQSTEPNCPGSYEGSMEFNGDAVSWSYKGQDCGGAMEGHGTARKSKG